MGEGWIPLSWVSMLLGFLEFLILVLGVGSAFQSSQYYSSAFICGAGFHIRSMLGGHRAGRAYLGAFCLCVPGSTESQAWTRNSLGKFMLTLGSTSGNAEGQLWFLALWSFSSAKLQHTSQSSVLLSRRPGPSSNQLSEKGMGLQVQATRWNFPVFSAGKIQTCVDLLPVRFWSQEAGDIFLNNTP